MYEFEDLSTGFNEIFLNKNMDSSGTVLDFYISDSMQDMLDIDIRTEVATVVGGVNEFTSLINDLPSLDFDSSSNDGVINWQGGGPKWSTSDISADVGACVNPNSVIPLFSSSLLYSPKSQVNLNTNNYHNPPLPSPKEEKSHLTFSPNQIKIFPAQENKRINSMLPPPSDVLIENIKKDLSSELKNEVKVKIENHNVAAINNIKLATGLGGITFANNTGYTKTNQINNIKTNTINNFVVANIKKERSSSPLQSTNTNTNNVKYNNTGNGQGQKIVQRSVIVQRNNVSISNGSLSKTGKQTNGIISKIKVKTSELYEYPKPAYSYSCLIAMALKNSRSGSLPVSEIYSFMCEHFPYFKTAPSGWKNSVRHNLSLNKCFEKIEKPTTNGGQRKGCLWAMNPTKISKMDDEVQKWSKKDPLAIRRAMVYPENLEALERGEMKHGSTGEDDGENDLQTDIEENSDSEQENECDENLIESSESVIDDDEKDKEYDIKISEIYENVELNDNGEIFHITTQNGEIIKLTEHDMPHPKRARLDVNYSISPAITFENQLHQQAHHNSRRKMQLVNRIV